MRCRDILVGDDGSPYARQPPRNLLTGAGDQVLADQDVVGPVAKPDLDGFDGLGHVALSSGGVAAAERCLSIASITSSAITSLRSSRVGTVTSASA